MIWWGSRTWEQIYIDGNKVWPPNNIQNVPGLIGSWNYFISNHCVHPPRGALQSIMEDDQVYEKNPWAKRTSIAGRGVECGNW